MVTDIQKIAEKHGVQELALPGWSAEEDFVCKLRRPTLMEMAATGSIPNPLLNTVRTLFQAKKKEIDEIPLNKQAEAMVAIAKYAMVEPSLEAMREAGLSLTDGQLMTIYAFAIGGAAALEPFRRLLGGRTGEPDGAVPNDAEPADAS